MRLAVWCIVIAALFVAGAASGEVSSTFDADAEGWTATNDTSVTYVASGGNPGGYLQYDEAGDQFLVDITAPAAFLGNWGIYEKGSILFDHKIFSADTSGGGEYRPYEIVLKSPADSVKWVGPMTSGVTDWLTFGVPLRESEWTVLNGTWAGVLANVTGFRIRIEMVAGEDIEGIDNVYLREPTYHIVAPDGSGDFPNIQAAIDAATVGDTIALTDGTFTGTGNRDINWGGKELTVRSESGDPASCIIDAQGANGNEHQVFFLGGGLTSDSRLEGVTIRGGYTDGAGLLPHVSGGGVYVYRTSPTISNCRFEDNYAYQDGGAVHVDARGGSDTPLFEDCVFSKNSTAGNGGAFSVRGGSTNPNIVDCVLVDNTGGAVWAFESGRTTLEGCAVVDNLGDGVGMTNLCLVTINSCTFYGNTGSAISNGDDDTTVDGCIIAYNASSITGNYGAAITCTDIYGNSTGNWTGGAGGYNGEDNFSLDPLFRDAPNGDVGLMPDSPCADRPYGCGQIGAYGVEEGQVKTTNTYSILPGGGGDFTTIQAAMDAVYCGDTIELADGTFTGNGNRDLSYGGKRLTVRSQSRNPEACIIDAQGANGNEHQGFFLAGLTSQARLEGVTIRGGYVDGAGLLPHVSGGGIYVYGANPTISNCRFEDNYAYQDGGGMHVDGRYAPTAPLIEDCVFSENSSVNGGAVSVRGYRTNPDIVDCILVDNTGGGAWIYDSGRTTLEGCAIVDNLSYGVGMLNLCTVTINSCTFYGNIGAAINNGDDDTTVDRCIIAYNAASISGPYGAAITCTDIYGNSSGDWTGGAGGYNGEDKFSLDPLFRDAPNGDVGLMPDSPCADRPYGCGLIGAYGVEEAQVKTTSTYTVIPGGGGDFTTIQAALNAAYCGDTIELADDTFTGNGNRDLSYGGKRLTVRSQSGDPEACIIDAEGSSSEDHQVFFLSQGLNADARLEGVTISGGYVDGGALPYQRGGGIYVYGASPTISNCWFVNNYALDMGGAVHCNGSTNQARTYPTFENCVFAQNQANSGGAVAAIDGWAGPTFTNCRFEGNQSRTASGGAAEFSSAGQRNRVNFTGCTFVANASAAGGALNCWKSKVTVSACTFYDENLAAISFGGTNPENELAIDRTIIAFNQASLSGSTPVPTLSCTDLYGNTGGNWVGTWASQGSTNDNLEEDPLFCDAENGILTLFWHSPCAPYYSPGECGLIGAEEVDCIDAGVEDPAETPALPTRTELLAARPDPFDSSVEIAFRLHRETPVSLRIFDVGGRLTRELVGGQLPAGEHVATWDGRDGQGQQVSAGVYFYQLETLDLTLTRRVTRLR